MDSTPPTGRKRKRASGKQAILTTGVSSHSTGGTIRERQQRWRSIIKAKKGNCSSELKKNTVSKQQVPVAIADEISYYGPPAHVCRYCGAQFWYQERVKRSYSSDQGHIRFHLCCRGGQKPEDRPDIVSRVFKLKVDELVSVLKKGTYFGKARAVLYTIEFQKRGLPHVHILVWLQASDGVQSAITN